MSRSLFAYCRTLLSSKTRCVKYGHAETTAPRKSTVSE
jgi:hypothetical protein